MDVIPQTERQARPQQAIGASLREIDLGGSNPVSTALEANQAPGALVVRRRRDGRILQINLFTDDYKLPSRRGNPQSQIHNHETETNPPRVWEFKHR